MEIKRIFVFENSPRVFHTKAKNRRKQVGYPVCVWTLHNKGEYYWESVVMLNFEVLYSLNSEKKRRWASMLSKKYNCKVIYTQCRNMTQRMFSIMIPFKKDDL